MLSCLCLESAKTKIKPLVNHAGMVVRDHTSVDDSGVADGGVEELRDGVEENL